MNDSVQLSYFKVLNYSCTIDSYVTSLNFNFSFICPWTHNFQCKPNDQEHYTHYILYCVTFAYSQHKDCRMNYWHGQASYETSISWTCGSKFKMEFLLWGMNISLTDLVQQSSEFVCCEISLILSTVQICHLGPSGTQVACWRTNKRKEKLGLITQQDACLYISVNLLHFRQWSWSNLKL
jgi:hypothetical protein